MSSSLGTEIEAVFPLSPTQEGMLYHTLRSPDSGVYLGQHTLELRHLDAQRLRETWRLIVRHHMALRSLFVWEELSRPVQAVYRQVEPDWQELDLRNSAAGLTGWLERDARQGFAMDARPASRVTLIRLAADRWLMVWTRHHLLMDGWSAHIVLRELHDAYSALSREEAWRPPPDPGMAAYIAWLQRQDASLSTDYWRQRLADLTVNPGLDAVRRSNFDAASSRRVHCFLNADQTARLTVCGKHQQLTLSTLVHGAWAAVLAAINETHQVTLGSTVSGRPAELTDAKQIVGNLINTVPVVVNARSPAPLSAWLRDLQRQIGASARHGHVAYREVLAAAELEAGTALFDSIVVFMNYPRDACDHTELSVVRSDYDEHSHYPVAVLALPGERLELILIHDEGVIAAGQADQLLEMLVARLAQLSGMMDAAAAEFCQQGRPAAVTPERTPLTVEPRPVTRFFHDAVACHGSRVALRDGAKSMSYARLDESTRRFGAAMAARGVKPGDRVVIKLPRGTDAIAALWATLRLGAAYVPVSPDTPEPRLQQICRTVDARLVVGDASGVVPNTLSMEDLDNSSAPGFEFDPATPLTDAYTIFTSGSTGTPKAVTVSHEQLAYSLASRLQYYGDAPIVFALFSPLAFDSSVAGLFWTVACGGCLVIVDEDRVLRPRDAVAYLTENRVNTLLTLPGVYRGLLHAVTPRLAELLRTSIVAGEACPADLLADHQAAVPNVTLVNEYGPTEATVWCAAARFTAADPVDREPYLSIGTAIPGIGLSIRDRSGNVVPPGVVGELVIDGPTVAVANTPDGRYATGDLVMQDDAGQLHFRGRVDQQLKVRGHRVDPLEIEAALGEFVGVRECVVRLADTRGATAHAPGVLTAFVAGDQRVTEEALRSHLAGRLPDYMRPRRFVLMAALPRNANGKIAGEQLLLPQRGAGSAPTSPMASALAGLWQAVLKLDAIGPDEDFFEMGGDSITGIQLVALAGKHGVEFSARDLFEYPSIRALARHLEARSREPARRPDRLASEHTPEADLDEMARVLSLD